VSSHQRQRVRRFFSRTQPQTAQTSSRSATTWRETFRQRLKVSNSSRIWLSSLSLNILTPPHVHLAKCNREAKDGRPATEKLVATLQFLCFHGVVLAVRAHPALECFVPGTPCEPPGGQIRPNLQGGVGNKLDQKDSSGEAAFPVHRFGLFRSDSGLRCPTPRRSAIIPAYLGGSERNSSFP